MAIRRDLSNPTLPVVKSYRQGVLLGKINQFLAVMKRKPLLSVGGHCHGLAVLWMQKMAEYREDWFYGVIKKIVDCPADKLAELDNDVDVLKFIAKIEYAQNCDEITMHRIRQIDIDKVLELKHEHYRYDYFSVKSLAKYIQTLSGECPAFMLGATESKHDVAIYCRDNQYYLFDANFDSGEAVKFNIATEATHEMSKCLFNDFEIPCAQWMTLRVVAVSPVTMPPPANHSANRLFSPPLPANTVREYVDTTLSLPK